MTDITLAITSANVGQAALVLSLLFVRVRKQAFYLPLILFFVANGFTDLSEWVSKFWPSAETIYVALTLPAMLALSPALWLYVEGLTSESKWQFRKSHWVHFIPVALGFAAAFAVMALDPKDQTAILIDEGDIDQVFPIVVALYILVLILGWIVQAGFYIARMLARLVAYRRRLKDLYASTDEIELGWVVYLIICIGGLWVIMFASIVSDIFFSYQLISDLWSELLALIVVWSLAIWGLRQKPGFESIYSSPQQPEPENEQISAIENPSKYEKSALSADQALRIQKKLESSMKADQLYLDPNLSLHTLSSHIGVTPNFVSQTLNETIGENFFDYINSWRIEAAIPDIISEKKTVLEIAYDVGFNSRSSFYKAFKKQTNQTPSAYRENQRKLSGADGETRTLTP